MFVESNFDDFLLNKNEFQVSPNDLKSRNLFKSKSIIFSYIYSENIEIGCKGHYVDNNFIIYSYGTSQRNNGYGSKFLLFLNNILANINIKIQVCDITSAAFPFWMKMYERNIIDNIIFDNFDIKSIINKNIYHNLISEMYNLYKTYKKADNWIKLLVKSNL